MLLIALIIDALDAAWAALNAPIEIPFLSQLYEWITGHQLTLP